VRLVLDARTAQDAAVRAIQWSLDGRAEIFREPERDRMREIEALEFQLDDEIEVSEVGFRPGSGEVFDVLDLPAVRLVARPCSAEVCESC
jgi:hypothetical protein